MDYSSFPNDPENPAGTSPWQSSPQPNTRPSFTTSETGSASAPSLTQHSSYANTSQRNSDEFRRDQETLGDGLNQQQGGRGTALPPENGISSETSQQLHSSDDRGFQQYRQQQSQQPQQPKQSQQSQQSQQPRGTGPNRYHGNNRSAQRQNLPQYRLQAKIAGLERTGRKDPILRFDVHVSFGRSEFLSRTALMTM